MKLVNPKTMQYDTVHLYNVLFSCGNTVQVYSPSDAEVMDIAGRLYARRGSFGVAQSFERVV